MAAFIANVLCSHRMFLEAPFDWNQGWLYDEGPSQHCQSNDSQTLGLETNFQVKNIPKQSKISKPSNNNKKILGFISNRQSLEDKLSSIPVRFRADTDIRSDCGLTPAMLT